MLYYITLYYIMLYYIIVQPSVAQHSVAQACDSAGQPRPSGFLPEMAAPEGVHRYVYIYIYT